MAADWRHDARWQWPVDSKHLWNWIKAFTGVEVARRPVCRGHTAPFFPLARMVLERPRPPLMLLHASRGGGKSFLSAIDTHLTSRWHARANTAILGGSLDQSEQIYNAIRKIAVDYPGGTGLGNDSDVLKSLLARSATYANGSEVSILACSDKSVRGPHVPSLKLDEVDEIDPGRREDAMGMCMAIGGVDLDPSVVYTSTWHRPGGPMTDLMARSAEGLFPSYTWCVYEVLERCPDWRSGRWVGGWAGYERCPACPLKPSCHADRDAHRGLPKAKRSEGHYSINSLVQKAKGVSARTFASDYACMGPKTEGLIYSDFDAEVNVAEAAEFDPAQKVFWSIDGGVCTAGVLFQVVERHGEFVSWPEVRVFADYYAEDRGDRRNARELLEVGAERCGGRRDRAFFDRNAKSRTSTGIVSASVYREEKLWPLLEWPTYPGSVEDGISLVDSFVRSGDGTTSLLVHPRCKRTIRAFQTYERAKVNGQWSDRPRDPQHPAEDLMDALRGGLHALYPEGRKPEPKLTRVRADKVF